MLKCNVKQPLNNKHKYKLEYYVFINKKNNKHAIKENNTVL
jgi:hypothetical protein